MGLIGAFVRRRVLVTVLMLIAVILGALSYTQMGLRRFPNIEFPFATIMTVMPGGSPEEIETGITKRIEDAISSIAGIDTVTSYSQQGLSLVLVQFQLQEDIDIRATDLSNNVDMIRDALPDAARDPIVSKFDISQSPILSLALSGPQGANELYRLADEQLEPRISQVAGVANVGLSGGEQREIHVLLDARKLRKYVVSVSTVAAALQMANVDVPAGHITQADREYVIRAVGRFGSVSALETVRVPTAGSGTITVGDLGRVVDTYAEARTVSRFDGRPGVMLTVQAQSDANEVQVADAVKARLPDLRGLLPEGATLEIAVDDTQFVRGALKNVLDNMIVGVLLTAAVLFLFLKSGRATAVIAVVMPVAIIATFTAMRFSGFSLNILSLTGLALTVGVLVSNAILILENTTRFLHQGHDPVEATVLGTSEIAVAVIGSTATNLVVFLPLAFMGEIVGRFFKELGLTVVYATVASLLVSFTLTPMMCGLMLKGREDDGSRLSRALLFAVGWMSDLWQWGYERVKAAYMAVLLWCLRWRRTTLLVTVILVVASLGVFTIVGAEFQPSMDEGRFSVTVQTPVGSPLEATDRAVRQVEDRIHELPYLQHISTRVGTISGFLGGSSEGVNLAEVVVVVNDRSEREETLDDLARMLTPKLAGIPGAQVSIAMETRGGGAPIEVDISGTDLGQMQTVADEVMALIESVPGTAGVAKSYQTGQPEIRVVPREDAGRLHRIERAFLQNEVRGYIEGVTATQFRDRTENYDVVVEVDDAQLRWADDVGRMFVQSPATGAMVRIDQVADVRREVGPTLITRKDRRRLITVTSQTTGDLPSGKVRAEIESRLNAEVTLPEGISVEFAGEAEMMRKNFAELFKAMATASVLTYLCTAGIIESFLMTAIIIFSLPVCLIGVAFAMLVGHVTVSLFSLMAMVILVGMAVNNAIVIVDYAMRRQREGASAYDAIVDACDVRLRMIVMSSLTTMVALIPLSLGLGFGGEIFQPLAIVEMGGVGAAAVLSLLVIPVIYVAVLGRVHRAAESA